MSNPAIPADINDLRSVAATLSDMIAMAYQAHNNCDIDSETECGGEQYGDGSADEHCRLRDAEATVTLIRLKHKAAKKATEVTKSMQSLQPGQLAMYGSCKVRINSSKLRGIAAPHYRFSCTDYSHEHPNEWGTLTSYQLLRPIAKATA